MTDKTFLVKEPKIIKPIPNGAYTGVIKTVAYRDKPFEYADVLISINEIPEAEIEAGFSSKEISPTSAFGKFISQFQQLKVGETVNPSSVLVGRKVRLMVMNIPGKKDATKAYPQVVKGTVTPL